MYVYILDRMSSVDDAMDHLIQDGCLSLDEQQEIKLPLMTPRDQTRKLLEILQTKGQAGFNAFIRGLERKNRHLAKRLKDEKKRIEDEELSSISSERG